MKKDPPKSPQQSVPHSGLSSTAQKWQAEKQALKAMQVAFDVEHQVQYHIRLQALQLGITPSDRIRQILGLACQAKPSRPRLSISLSERDFAQLAQDYGLAPSERVEIKRRAAQQLIEHVQAAAPPTE